MRVYMIYRSLFLFLKYIIIIYMLLTKHELVVDCRLSRSLSTIARAVDYSADGSLRSFGAAISEQLFRRARGGIRVRCCPLG